MDILTCINPSTLPLYTYEQQKPISISRLPLSVYSVPLVLHRVHLLIRLGHYISGCWPNQRNKGSLRALLPISIIRLQLKKRAAWNLLDHCCSEEVSIHLSGGPIDLFTPIRASRARRSQSPHRS